MSAALVLIDVAQGHARRYVRYPQKRGWPQVLMTHEAEIDMRYARRDADQIERFRLYPEEFVYPKEAA